MMNKDVAAAILQDAVDKLRAGIYVGNTQKPFKVQKVVVPLDTAKLETAPLKFNFPFRTLYIQEATDSSTVIKFKPGAQDSYQSDFNMRSNDSWSDNDPTTEAIFFWDAQPGKSITLVFFVDSEFRSGRQVSVQSGGVIVSEGVVVEATTRVVLSPATATIIAPANPDRVMCLIENATGSDLFISGANTLTDSGSNRGIKIASGDYYTHKNTAVLYGYSTLGGNVHYMEHE